MNSRPSSSGLRQRHAPGVRPFRSSPAALFGVLFVALCAVTSVSPFASINSTAQPSLIGHAVSAPHASVSSQSADVKGLLAPHPALGPLYGSVASTLDLVDNRTLPGDAQPATQDLPQSIVFDPANGELYVRGNSGESITVVNGSSDVAVAEVEVQECQNPDGLTDPQSIAPVGGSLYVANEGPSASLSILNGTTNEVTGTINLAGSPDAVIDDPANGDLYVPIWILNEVVVVNTSSHDVVNTVPVGSHPYALLLDPTDDQVFVANYGSGNVSVISTLDNSVVANIVTGTDPVALAWDSDDDVVDVTNTYNGNPGTVTLIQAPATPSSHGGDNVSVGRDPQALAYAPIQDALFVANGGSENVSVIDQTTGHVIANPAAGAAPAAIAFDASNHDVYVLNSESPSFNITILAASTDHDIGNVPIDNYFAYGLAVDTTNGNIFAVSEGSFTESGSPPHAQANVTVVSGLTNAAIASVPVVVYPEGMTYDPHLGDLLVADPGGNDTYLINTTSDALVGTRPADLLPERSAFDSLNNEVYVLGHNESGSYIGEVTVLNPNLVAIKNITTYDGPTGIAFDSANGKFYVTDNIGGNITVLNGTTNKFNTTISVAPGANLYSDLYDPHNQEVYVTDLGTNQVVVINGSNDEISATIRVGTEPEGLAFDSRNDTVFVVNGGSGNVSVINDSTNSVAATFSLPPGALAYDSANNILYDADSSAGELGVYNASTYLAAGPALSLGSTDYPHGVVYDPANQFVYVSTEYNGSISIIPSATYPVTFVESGLPVPTEWSVTLGSEQNMSSGVDVGFQEPNGLYDFTVGAVSGYTANVTSGSVRVAGASVTVDIGFSSATQSYSVTFVEAGLPGGSPWNVTLNGVQNHSSTPDIGFIESAGTWPFVVGAYTGYVANNSSGNVSVSTQSVTVDIGFSPVSSTFAVTFIESGLPHAEMWTVSLDRVENGSDSASIGFRVPNGTWPYSVLPVSGYVANVTAGNVTVSGASVDVFIGFSSAVMPRSYWVNFTETGLPSGTGWSVMLNGTGVGDTLPTISFLEPNGTYPFTVGAVTGYSADPDSGFAHVAGGPFAQTIAFSAGTVALSAKLTAVPSTITLGNSTILTTTTSGGSPPFAYAYTGLPNGCGTENTSSFSCKPTETGQFTINVTVTETHGSSITVSTTLNVTSGNSGGGPSSSPSLSTTELLLIIVVVVVLALVILFFVWRRRRSPPPTPPNSTSPPAAPPT